MFIIALTYPRLVWRSLIVGAVALVALVFITARAAEGGPDGLLHVTVLDIGQGDAILVQAPNGTTALIDGGPDQRVLAKLGEYLGPSRRQIDLVVASHWHADHIGGLIDVLQRYRVGQFIGSQGAYTSGHVRELRRLITEQDIPFVEARAGQVFDLGDATTLTVVYPFESFASRQLDNAHDANVTVLVRHGQATVLLTGDMEKSGEDDLRTAGIVVDSDVLKIGHHGSKTSSSQLFLDAVSPAAALISVGARNSYHHPTTEVLDRLEQSAIPYYRTDTQGDLRLVTDGQYIRLTQQQ